MEEMYREIINSFSNVLLGGGLVVATFSLYACAAYFSSDKEQRKLMKKSLENSVQGDFHKN